MSRSSECAGGSRVRLNLLGGFTLRVDDEEVPLPMHSRRVLAYLSLDRSTEPDCDRRVLAERLWPDSTGDRARASLRTALWRIRAVSPGVVRGHTDRLRLADSVEVDLEHFHRYAHRLLTDPESPVETHQHLVSHTVELLPGWDETWLLLAREQMRQLRLHALEASARRLVAAGRNPEAIVVILALVAEEPLRESAQAALIDVHLCEGNVSEARRQLADFVRVLGDELGILPSPALFARVGVPYPTGPTVAAVV